MLGVTGPARMKPEHCGLVGGTVRGRKTMVGATGIEPVTPPV